MNSEETSVEYEEQKWHIDVDWFEQYKKALDAFTNDIEGYSAQAWKQRDGWEITFRTRWAGSRFKKIISSDQDFLSHLMHTGQIKQDSIESIMFALKDYLAFQNPLFFHCTEPCLFI